MCSPSPAINAPMALPSKQAGVGLIEILVAIVVLSIGLLGMAALQTRALSTNSSAMTQSMAVLASYSILEAMQADRTNALAGAYNHTVTANGCPTTQATLAQTQLGAWCSQLAQNMGALATTTGTVNCQPNGACKVTVQFDDSRATSTRGTVGLANQTVVTDALL